MAYILIANDEIDLLTLCQQALEDAGHDAQIVTSGKEVVERARREKPDLIVVDWVMPDTDGSAVMATLKGLAETKDIPVLAMSALRDGAIRAAMAGADSFLAKPFDDGELVNAVNRTLATWTRGCAAE
jgi:DNA-binding response OmpR family regulator